VTKVKHKQTGATSVLRLSSSVLWHCWLNIWHINLLLKSIKLSWGRPNWSGVTL